jgi:hypothetical protein
MGGTQGLELGATLPADAWVGIVTMQPVAAPGRRQRKCDGDQLEVLFTGGTLRDMANVQGGMAMLSRQVGVPEATLQGWRSQVIPNSHRRPWMPRRLARSSQSIAQGRVCPCCG